MEASLAVPQRKAMSSTMKMMKMESMAIASAYGWCEDRAGGKEVLVDVDKEVGREGGRTYTPQPSARQGELSSSRAGSSKWIKAVAIYGRVNCRTAT